MWAHSYLLFFIINMFFFMQNVAFMVVSIRVVYINEKGRYSRGRRSLRGRRRGPTVS